MKKKVILIIVGLLLINIIIINSETNEDKISSEVYKNLENKDEVRVIVELKEPDPEKGIFFKINKSDVEIEKEKQEIKEEIKQGLEEENVKHEFNNEIAIEISLKDIEKLRQNPNVKEIRIDKPIEAFLQDSVPLINATRTWPMEILNTNLTGTGETVCVIDTGINFSHPDLIGKNKTCIIDCVGKACVENCSISDDNGHGTHVAGIVGANGIIKGIAINVNLIGVKILNAAGSGSDSDLYAGLDWCIQNANLYNISVISLSLGVDCDDWPQYCYDYYCDSEDSSTALRINNATGRNISVIISTGNDGSTSLISSPSCIKNVTSVGASDKSDNIAGYSNRNSLVDLLAPGTNINSTRWSTTSCKTGGSCVGNYMILSGTSMATPHVSGAFAIIRQAFKLMNNRTPTPLEIQNILNSTGKKIYDSGTNLNFSRINIYSAILSIDNIYPNVSLVYPLNNHFNSSNNQTFICNASDNFGLSNITIKIWNSSSLYYNYTNQVSGNFSQTSFNVTNLLSGNYKWNCLAYDLNNNPKYASSNFSLDILTNFSVLILSPTNNTFIIQNQTNFSCFSQTIGFNLNNITLNIWNSSNLVYNITKNINGISNYTNFTYNFSEEGIYQWNCLIYNNISQFTSSENNTLIFDTINPIISSITNTVSYNSATISWSTNELSNSSVNYGVDLNLSNISSNTERSLTNSVSLNGLSSSTLYYYNISSCDIANNCITNGTYNFTTSATPAVIQASSGSGSGNGGGGGGGSTSGFWKMVYNADNVIYSSRGYVRELPAEERIRVNIANEEHYVGVVSVNLDSAVVQIMSNPFNVTFKVGDEKKFDLNKDSFNDLYIKLNGIVNKKANLTVKSIHEELPKQITGKAIENPINKTNEEENKEENIKQDLRFLNLEMKKIKIFIYILLIMLIGFIGFLIFKRIEMKKDKERIKKDHKEIFNKHLNHMNK